MRYVYLGRCEASFATLKKVYETNDRQVRHYSAGPIFSILLRISDYCEINLSESPP
jgi:hypothetical protein